MDNEFSENGHRRVRIAASVFSAVCCFAAVPYILYRLVHAHGVSRASTAEVFVGIIGILFLGLAGRWFGRLAWHIYRNGRLDISWPGRVS